MNSNSPDAIDLFFNVITFLMLVYTSYLTWTIRKMVNVPREQQPSLPQTNESKIENDLGRRLLEIQRGKYSRTYVPARRGRGEED